MHENISAPIGFFRAAVRSRPIIPLFSPRTRETKQPQGSRTHVDCFFPSLRQDFDRPAMDRDRRRRGVRAVHARGGARRERQRAMARHRRRLRLSDRLSLLCLVHRAKAVAARRQSPDAGASPQRRARLRADRQICAVRPSFRGHRRRRPAGRTRARRANGLSARRAMADDRRRLRRRGAGHACLVHFDAPRRPLARRSRQNRDGRGRGVRRDVRHPRDHGHSARGARPRRHQGAGRQSLGRLHRFRDIADRGLHGRLWRAICAPAVSSRCR